MISHTSGLRVTSRIEAIQYQQVRSLSRLNDPLLVVVDIEFRVWISRPSSFKGNADEVLSKDVVEHAGSQCAIFVEDLIDHVL